MGLGVRAQEGVGGSGLDGGVWVQQRCWEGCSGMQVNAACLPVGGRREMSVSCQMVCFLSEAGASAERWVWVAGIKESLEG